MQPCEKDPVLEVNVTDLLHPAAYRMPVRFLLPASCCYIVHRARPCEALTCAFQSLYHHHSLHSCKVKNDSKLVMPAGQPHGLGHLLPAAVPRLGPRLRQGATPKQSTCQPALGMPSVVALSSTLSTSVRIIQD